MDDTSVNTLSGLESLMKAKKPNFLVQKTETHCITTETCLEKRPRQYTRRLSTELDAKILSTTNQQDISVLFVAQTSNVYTLLHNAAFKVI